MVTLYGCLPSERLWIVSNRSSKAVFGLGSFCSVEIISNEAPRERPPSFDPLRGQSHLNSDAKVADEGRPQGAPLTSCPLFSARKPASSLEKGTHKGCPYQLSSLDVMPREGRPQGAPLPDSGSLTWVCPNLMQLPWTLVFLEANWLACTLPFR